MKYVYTSWFRDGSVSADDPDHEWPACFIIDGKSNSSARRWGDVLAKRYASRHDQVFVKSSIEDLEGSDLPGTDSLPVIAEDHLASDDEIGW